MEQRSNASAEGPGNGNRRSQAVAMNRASGWILDCEGEPDHFWRDCPDPQSPVFFRLLPSYGLLVGFQWLEESGQAWGARFLFFCINI